MKYSKTAIKELTARYRTVLLHAALVSAIAMTGLTAQAGVNVLPDTTSSADAVEVATQADLDATNTAVAGKADQSALDTLSETVNTKADKSAVSDLTNTVTTLKETVDKKADQSDVTQLQMDVGDLEVSKADASDVTKLTGQVGAVADRVDSAETAISKLETSSATKAELQAVKDAAATKTELVATNSKVELLEANSATKTELQAVVNTAATKTELQAVKDAAATKTELATTNSKVELLEANSATKTELATTNSKVADLETNSATKTELQAVKTEASTALAEAKTEISSTYATKDALKATDDKVAALQQNSATKEELANAKSQADATYATKESLATTNGKVETLTEKVNNAASDLAKTDETVKGLQDSIIATNAVIGNGVIDNALAGTLTGKKLGEDFTVTDAVEKLNATNEAQNAALGGIINTGDTNYGSYNEGALVGNGFEKDTTSLTDSLNKYAENVKDATGTTYNADGTFKNEYVLDLGTVGADIADTDSLVAAIGKVNTNLENVLTEAGTEVNSKKVDVQWNGTDSTLDTVLGSGAYTSENHIAKGDSVTDAVSKLDAEIGAAVGGNIIKDTNTVNQNLAAIDKTIGGAVTGTNGHVSADNTVNQNLDKIDETIGASVSGNIINGSNTINANLAAIDETIGAKVEGVKGNVLADNTVNQNLDKIDAAIGDRTNIGSANAAINDAVKTDIASALKATGDAIGSADFTGTNYAGKTQDGLTGAIKEVDSELKKTNDELAKTNATIGAGTIGEGAAGTLTGATIGTGENTTTVTSAIETLNATNVSQNATLNALAGLVDGGSVDAATGAITKGTALSDKTNADGTGKAANIVEAVNNAAAVNQAQNTALGVVNADGTYNGNALTGNGFVAGGTSLGDSLKTYAANNAAAMGTTFKEDGTFENGFASTNHVAKTDSFVQAVSKLDAQIGAPVTGANGNVVAGNTIHANLDSLDKNMGSLGTLTAAAIGGQTGNVTAAVNALATNVGNAMGGQFAADGKWTGTVNTNAAVNYGETTHENVMSAVNQVASNIGAGVNGNIVKDTNTVNANLAAIDQAIGAPVAGVNGNVVATNSVNQNLDKIDAAIGNLASLQTANKNLTNGTATAPTTIVEALNNVDATLGTIHGLTDKLGEAHQGNLATGTTVEQHLTSIDAAIGNRAQVNSANVQINEAAKKDVASALRATGNAIGDTNFQSSHYLRKAPDLTSAVRTLDSEVNRLDNQVGRLDRKVTNLDNEMRAGFASVAALTGLAPGTREMGDTQLSIGTGMYQDRVGFALGAYHYVNDNVLLNAGASYGGTESTIVKGGVTFGW